MSIVTGSSVGASWTTGLCNTAQQMLDKWVPMNLHQGTRTQNGLVEAVQSSMNLGNSGDVLHSYSDGGRGGRKIRGAKWFYSQRDTAADTSSSLPTCGADAEEENTPSELEYGPSDYTLVRTKVKYFSEDEIRRFCAQGQDEWVSRTLMGMIDSMVTSMDQAGLTLYETNAGNFRDGTATLTDNWLNSTNNWSSIPYGEHKLLQEVSACGITAAPFVVANGNMDIYTRNQNIGCCNNWGQDIGGTGNFMYYRDLNANSSHLASNNTAIVFAPGAVRLDTFSKYEHPDFQKANDNFIHGVITDPITGLTFNLWAEYNNCAGSEAWKMYMFTEYCWMNLPSDLFKATDELTGVNHLFQITVNNS